ncbi:MAG: hypothetical protein QHH26_05330 [Armatimonadota bacterium]|nr:hypothetical protein [Armatimonadota bacterium]
MSTPTEIRTTKTVETTAKPQKGLTKRVVFIAFILTIINDYWIVQMEVVRYSFATYAAPFYNCLFTLLVLTLINMGVRSKWPKFALSRAELTTIYIMVSITSAVLSHNMMEILVSLIGYAFFFQSPENNWANMFLHRLPKWLTVSDPKSLRNFYYGNSTLYDPANFTPWIIPVISWSVFCFVLIITMLCINSIFRKHWIESERLTFPVVMLPLEMTDETGSLFKNKYMWIGFAFSGMLTLLAGLNYLFPSVPHIQIVRRDIGKYIVNQPWKSMGGIPLGFYFWAIGIAFLMPFELSFSCWFFYWLVKLELVASHLLGLHELMVVGGGFDRAYPFVNSQAYGAYLGFFVMSMWTGRHYLKKVFRTAFLKTREIDESREAISYRTAILGAIAGILFLSLFAYRMGMSPLIIVIFFVLYFMFAVIVSRIRAELGFPTHDMHVMGPQNPIVTAAGTQNLSPQDLVGFSMFYWFNRTYASHPSPHEMEGYKLSERTDSHARQMFYAVGIAAIYAMPIGFWMLLHTYYQNGGATANMEQWALGFGKEVYNQLAGWMKQPFPPNPTAFMFVGVGFLGSMFLGWMRVRFLWFPFHPLAYGLASSWGVAQLWMPLFIGSTAKLLTLKFGGLSQYKRALPFFYGLILGEITIGCLWTIIGIVLDIPTYDFWPGKFAS